MTTKTNQPGTIIDSVKDGKDQLQIFGKPGKDGKERSLTLRDKASYSKAEFAKISALFFLQFNGTHIANVRRYVLRQRAEALAETLQGMLGKKAPSPDQLIASEAVSASVSSDGFDGAVLGHVVAYCSANAADAPEATTLHGQSCQLLKGIGWNPAEVLVLNTRRSNPVSTDTMKFQDSLPAAVAKLDVEWWSLRLAGLRPKMSDHGLQKARDEATIQWIKARIEDEKARMADADKSEGGDNGTA